MTDSFWSKSNFSKVVSLKRVGLSQLHHIKLLLSLNDETCIIKQFLFLALVCVPVTIWRRTQCSVLFFFIILSSTKEARRKSNVEKCYHFNAFLAMIQISTENR